MAKQSHDIGYQKRLEREREEIVETKSPIALARSLVKRGICSPTILGGRP